MSKSKQTPIEAFNALSPEQKEREYRALDREFTRAETLPLTAKQRKAWRKFKERRRQRGGPKVGQGDKVVSLTIELGLFRRTDVLARQQGEPRADCGT